MILRRSCGQDSSGARTSQGADDSKVSSVISTRRIRRKPREGTHSHTTARPKRTTRSSSSSASRVQRAVTCVKHQAAALTCSEHGWSWSCSMPSSSHGPKQTTRSSVSSSRMGYGCRREKSQYTREVAAVQSRPHRSAPRETSSRPWHPLDVGMYGPSPSSVSVTVWPGAVHLQVSSPVPSRRVRNTKRLVRARLRE